MASCVWADPSVGRRSGRSLPLSLKWVRVALAWALGCPSGYRPRALLPSRPRCAYVRRAALSCLIKPKRSLGHFQLLLLVYIHTSPPQLWLEHSIFAARACTGGLVRPVTQAHQSRLLPDPSLESSLFELRRLRQPWQAHMPHGEQDDDDGHCTSSALPAHEP